MQAASILPFHFAVLTLFGIWCPKHWSPFRRHLRNVHLLLVIATITIVISLQLARLFFIKLTFKEIKGTFTIVIASGSGFFKFFFHIVNREKVIELIDMFQETCCLAHDDFERKLKRRYDDACRKIGKALLLLVELTVLSLTLIPLVGGIASRRLPYKTLQPYSLSLPLVYWMTFAHQVLAIILLSGVHVITDAIITGFMFQLCGQLDLVAYRLSNLSSKVQETDTKDEAKIVESSLLRNIVEHHVYIYKLAGELFKLFKSIIIVQFYTTTLQICMIVYQLTTGVTNIFELSLFSCFLLRTLTVLYLYCYLGNELSLKSINLSDTIFNVDWSSLSTISRKNLSFMIFRSSKPIKISDGVFMHLTMQTFTSVIKASYSAFSLLKS